MARNCLYSAAMALALAATLAAQRGPARPGAGPQRGMAGRSIPGMPRPGVDPKPAAARLPVDRWNAMTPEQRDRALQKLPPDRQQKIRDQIARFNSLPEKEQQRLRDRYRRLQQLPPEKQEAVRRELRQFNETPPERRRVLAREMRQLRGMSEDEQRTRVKSDEFRTRYTPEEQQMLQDLSDYLRPAQD
jgi:hypothetical protein